MTSRSDVARAQVDVRGVSKRFGRTLALDDVGFVIAAGEQFALLGPNGAGKTTLIHILCTILRADSGTVTVSGVDVAERPLAARRQLGVVFQETTLDTRLTVFENLDFHGRIFGVPGRVRRRRIDSLLALVELSDWRDHLVRELSRGMQRRLEVARALVHDARLLVLDEPTVGLDAQTRARIWEHLVQLRAERELTLLVTTHYIEEVETCDRVCIIDRGRVLAIGDPGALKARHGVTTVRVDTDETTATSLLEQFPGSTKDGTEVLIPLTDDAFVGAILGRFGSRLTSFSVEKPSLESVFLSLTGEQIRDRTAGPTDRLLAFGKRGGEHTR